MAHDATYVVFVYISYFMMQLGGPMLWLCGIRQMQKHDKNTVTQIRWWACEMYVLDDDISAIRRDAFQYKDPRSI